MAVTATRITAPWWKATRTPPAPDSCYTREQLGDIGDIKPSADDTFTETWLVRGYNDDDLYDVIIADAFEAGLPEPGEEHPVETGWYVASAEFEQLGKEDNLQAVVTCQRDPELLPTEQQYFTNHVVEEASQTEYETTGDSRNTGVKADTGYTNSRGDPYSPAPQMPRPRVRWEVTKRVSYDNFDPEELSKYTDCTNKEPFGPTSDRQMPAHYVFLSDIRSVLVKQPYWHYVLTYCFEIDEENYDQWILDAGPMYNDANGKKVLFADDYGVSHGGINLLDGFGGEGDPETPSYNIFGMFAEADFNELELFDPA